MVELLNRRLREKETEGDRGREVKEKQMSRAAVTGADMKGWRAKARRASDNSHFPSFHSYF